MHQTYVSIPKTFPCFDSLSYYSSLFSLFVPPGIPVHKEIRSSLYRSKHTYICQQAQTFPSLFFSFLSAVTYKKIKTASLVYSSSMQAPIIMMLFDAHKLYSTTRGIHLIKHESFVKDFQPSGRFCRNMFIPITKSDMHENFLMDYQPSFWLLAPQEYIHILKANLEKCWSLFPTFPTFDSPFTVEYSRIGLHKKSGNFTLQKFIDPSSTNSSQDKEKEMDCTVRCN